MTSFDLSWGPVVVAGVGGSGTRVVADFLATLGFHLGGDQNPSRDNLSFTMLFKRPRWFVGEPAELADEVRQAARVLGRALRGEGPLDDGERAFVESAAREMFVSGHTHDGSGAGAGDGGGAPGGSWAALRVRHLLDAHEAAPGRAVGWGWKEPNSHLFLPELAEVFPEMRFVLVMRHGLDMAFSRNQQQLVNWGQRFGISAPTTTTERPARSVDYWIAANQHAIDLGAELLGERFITLDFDALCHDPAAGVERFIDFLGCPASWWTRRKLTRIPKPPASIGRFREHGTEGFTAEQIEAVRRLGFEV